MFPSRRKVITVLVAFSLMTFSANLAAAAIVFYLFPA
jgi:hypothetical protein